MPSVRVTNVLLFCIALGIATTAAAQTSPAPQQPRLEILTRQGDFYWVVETSLDGTRKGGWVNVSVPLDRIDRNAFKPLPALPPLPSAQGSPDAASVNERLARIEQALAAAAGQSAGPPDVTTQPATSVQSVPLGQVTQPRPQGITPQQGPRPQTREGFWFNAGLGFGSAGCQTCFGREGGASGGLSLGGTISDKVLLGVGTTGWYKSVDGVTVNVGTLDARVRFYPSTRSGFSLTGGLGLGTVSLGVAGFGSESETGVGLMFGLGWDIRVGRNVSLTPFYNGFAVRTSNADAYVDQIGLGITIH